MLSGVNELIDAPDVDLLLAFWRFVRGLHTHECIRHTKGFLDAVHSFCLLDRNPQAAWRSLEADIVSREKRGALVAITERFLNEFIGFRVRPLVVVARAFLNILRLGIGCRW